jgi:hypothetical protein
MITLKKSIRAQDSGDGGQGWNFVRLSFWRSAVGQKGALGYFALALKVDFLLQNSPILRSMLAASSGISWGVLAFRDAKRATFCDSRG